LSLFQNLPFDRIHFLEPLGKRVTSGWQLLNITTLTSGSPFTVFSGIQQTGVGAGGPIVPIWLRCRIFPRAGRSAKTISGAAPTMLRFFNTDQDLRRYRTESRSLWNAGPQYVRGPAFHQFDFALIKDTAFGRRGKNELGILELRAEFSICSTS